MDSLEGSASELEHDPALDWVQGIATLYDAGHYEQAAERAGAALESFPGHPSLHYLRGLAVDQLDRVNETRLHVEFLLEFAPDWPLSHYLASRYARARKKWKAARQHLQTALQADPENAGYHAELAMLEGSRGNLFAARKHINTARALSPDDPAIIQFDVSISKFDREAAKHSWERIRDLEEALRLDPNNAASHASLGEVYLDELDKPAEAEEAFHRALALQPANAECQKLLFRAIGKRRFLYRVLSLPIRACEWVGHVLRGLVLRPLAGLGILLMVLIGFKVVLAFLAWLFLAMLIFWPAAKLYEWLLIAELRSVAEASDQRLRLKWKLNRLPIWTRVTLFLLISSAVWLGLIYLLGVPPGPGAAGLLAFTAIHFVGVGLGMLFRKARAALGLRAANRAR